jgi:hypothetical protein
LVDDKRRDADGCDPREGSTTTSRAANECEDRRDDEPGLGVIGELGKPAQRCVNW